MAVSTVQATPNLDIASWMGSYLEKHKTTGTSFLPTATAWDFSPPQLHQYCLGQPQPQPQPQVVQQWWGWREGQISMLTLHLTASSSPSSFYLLNSESQFSPYPKSPFSLFTDHHCPFLIPKVLWWKSLGRAQVPDCVPIPGFTWEMDCICSTHSLLYSKVFWSFGNCTSLPNMSNVEPGLGTIGSWGAVLGVGG